MRTIGITGGIGSGKSTICKVFETFGVPVFYADEQARNLYFTDSEVSAGVKKLFGHAVDERGQIQMQVIAREVFSDPEKLSALNALVHPAVKRAFDRWKQDHAESTYVIREAAILIETGSYKDCDEVILVTAPEEIRLKRAMALYNLGREDVAARMNRQWSDEQKRPFAQFELVNDGSELLVPKLNELHQHFMQKAEG